MKDKYKVKFGKMSYCSGHPWYYVLGGTPMSVKEIWTLMQEPDRYGYLKDDIEKSAGNNQKLRKLQADIRLSLNKDISRYRRVVFEFNQFRKSNSIDLENPKCEDIHVSMSLKVSHLLNGFANQRHVNDLLAHQPELFDIL
ncbi:MAG: hypothetical protein R8N23_10530 [Reichenbachiella sp.]|uniref:hypothetical protein n=1 Tax=Reichenbachiella sp. TaxID=2184521 RepID=UPI002965F9AA|nr:hypothetical protein [Reichenbachiella sp.]MDW3210294.1 hypothetical protein [Reichenbachiella sp.]